MGHLSQFEREMLAKAEQEKRGANIQAIKERLNEAQSLMEVAEEYNERIIIKQEIDKLNKMLSEETRLFESAGVSREDTDNIVAGMTF